ncbi:L-threonylcarbamoyladenylate synthase [Portibacter lacus]|uniref:Threonylcarbamoyl-AMP synthase n=1 Tax=Portibacter lacus TaxID=1099794 RepID=A0AA37WDM7_9BACT|nr:L-threonylcarbamoyladenylate synthase [Portibacter lacus]GLR17098.1 threonylcarbamoyl-AMP synthase [Portibacter lacus]
MSVIGSDLQKAIDLLLKDELVAIPTETVYGLAGNALSEVAITKIFEVKNRPFFDPLIIHTNDLGKISALIKNIPDEVKALAAQYMPGPLTILLEKTDLIPELITAGSNKVAVRIPAHPLTLKLLAALDFPLAAPSANPFGYISPTTAEHVNAQLGEKISYILDGGPCTVGLESTIVEWREDHFHVLRKGGVPLEQLGENVTFEEHSTSNPLAPGMLKSHYSPRIPLIIEPSLEDLEEYNIERIGVLTFQHPHKMIPLENQLILSKTGDVNEAARHLFSYMHELDEMDIDLIIAEYVPDEGLGKAINDKLKRAAI